MPAFDIICLANSRKHQGRCVAGLRIDGQGWIRPVEPRTEGVLSRHHYVLDDGSEARLLDLFSIDVKAPRPEIHQPENWSIGRVPWKLLARPAPQDMALQVLQSRTVCGPDLLGGQNDRIPFASFPKAADQASLALVMPQQLEWRLTTSPRRNRQTRAMFTLSGVHYDLSVTDPIIEQRLSALPLGHHPITAAGFEADERILLTISLGEPFQDQCYKLVAAVIAL